MLINVAFHKKLSLPLGSWHVTTLSNNEIVTFGRIDKRPIGLLIYRMKFATRDWCAIVYYLACIQRHIYSISV